MNDWHVLGAPAMTIEEVEAMVDPTEEAKSSALSSMQLLKLESMGRVAILLYQLRTIRTKPLFGGVFGSGRYVMASYAHALDGLDTVNYFVLDEKSWLPIGTGASKSEALAIARQTLATIDLMVLARYAAAYLIRRDAFIAEKERQHREARDAYLAEQEALRPVAVKSIPKRRKQIFEASQGMCHYCGTTLTLDGRWHIEHKMPKALMGGNEPSNLVASCAPCNHKKRDMTDQEFTAKRGSA